MKIKLFTLIAALAAFAFGAAAQDKLAIAEPVAKGGVSAAEVEAIWGMLEASVDGGFELISRSALKDIMTEVGFTVGSDLTALDSTQKARLGEIKTVKYLLSTTVSKIGDRLNIALVMVDASTGAIDPARRSTETVLSLSEFADKLPDMLTEMGLGREPKSRGRSALLTPVIKVKDAPEYLAEDFNIRLEEALLNGDVKLHNLQSVTQILKRNGIGDLNEIEPALFARIGNLLRVDYLVQPTVTRFSAKASQEYINVTRKTVTRLIGDIDGNIRVISAQSGEVAASIPFRLKVDFDDLEDTDDWSSEDYGKYMIERIIPEIAEKVITKLK